MQRIDAKIKPFAKVWDDDVKVLRLSHPRLDLGSPGRVPDERNASILYNSRDAQWLHPPNPFELNPDSLCGVVDSLLPKIENALGAKLLDMPSFEILDEEEYLPRINELEREVNASFGYGTMTSAPPTMYHCSMHGIVLMPKKYLIICVKSIDTAGNIRDFDVLSHEWDKPYLETAIGEALTKVAFRQHRGEWKEGYLTSMKRVGPQVEMGIHLVNELIAQHVKERVALSCMPLWGIYVVADKIAYAWQNQNGMFNYLGIEAMARDKALIQAAMVDGIGLRAPHAYVAFHPKHPNDALKQQRFNYQKGH